MASGVPLSSACLPTYQELKLGKKHKYIVFSLNKTSTEIVVEKASANPDYDEFLRELPENGCRWAVYDFEFEKDQAKRNKICFISWAPDTAKVREKMVFASSRDVLKRALVGIGLEIQATDSTEISHETVLNKAYSTTR